MHAAVLTAPGQFTVHEVPVPVPKAGEVLVRLEGCGICGSNLPPFEGRAWFQYPWEPGAPGHEGWGLVTQTGEGVTCVKPGTRVAVLSYHAFAEYDVAAEGAVIPLPEELAGKPFPGEPLGCAMNAFARCDIKAGHTVAVVGTGFLGTMLAQLAAQAGARVIAIGRRPFALALARKLGAETTIPMDVPERVMSEVQELTKGKGCDRVIEAVGLQGPLDLAAQLTRERGRLIIAGYHQDGLRQVNLQMWNWRGLDVINAHERDPEVYVEGTKAAVRAVMEGRLDPAPLFTHIYRLENINAGFGDLRDRPKNFLKGLISL